MMPEQLRHRRATGAEYQIEIPISVSPLQNRNDTGGGNVTGPVFDPGHHYSQNYASSQNANTPGETVMSMLILFGLFSACLILLKIFFFRQQLHDASNETERRASEEKKTLRRQKQIESNIIIKTISCGSPTTPRNEGGVDVDIENPATPSPATEGWEGKDSIIVVCPSDEESQVCAICLCEYVDREEVCSSRNPDCSHFFHAPCGVAWLAKHSECPICRADYLFEGAADVKGESEISAQVSNTTDDPPVSSVSETGGGEDGERAVDEEQPASLTMTTS